MQQGSTWPALSRQRACERRRGYYPHTDALGSVRQWSNSAGAAVGSAAYDPFGVPLAGSSIPAVLSTGGSWGYAGEWTDPSGLQYLRARWYNPAIGRFMQVDPFAGMLSQPGTLNPYIYGLNNPVTYTDPSGESPLALLVAAGFLGGVIADAALQYQENGWRCYDPGRALWAGAKVGVAAGMAALTTVSFVYLAALSLQGLGVGLAAASLTLPGWAAGISSFGLWAGTSLAGVGLSTAALAAMASTWLWTGQTSFGLQLASGATPGASSRAANQEISPAAQHYLALLPKSGTSTPAPSGTMSAELMAELQREGGGDEFALLRVRSGERILFRGTGGIWSMPPDRIRLIAHTHPSSLPLHSGTDVQTLLEMYNDPTLPTHQTWSLVISGEGTWDKFYMDGTHITPPLINWR